MQAWFAEADLTSAPPPAQRLFRDLCLLLDHLHPSNLAPDRQTAEMDGGGEAIIRLVHANDQHGDLDIEVGDRTTHIYGLYGHDEDYALPGDAEEVWRADSITTIAGLLRGRYHVECLTWRGRPYRTHVTDLTGDARGVVTLDSLLGLVPLPQSALTVVIHEIDYGCQETPSDPGSER